MTEDALRRTVMRCQGADCRDFDSVRHRTNAGEQPETDKERLREEA